MNERARSSPVERFICNEDVGGSTPLGSTPHPFGVQGKLGKASQELANIASCCESLTRNLHFEM